MRQSLPLMHFYSGKLLQFYSGVDSERSHLLAVDVDGANQLIFLEHWYGDGSPNATKLDGFDRGRMTLCIKACCGEVGALDRLLSGDRLRNVATRHRMVDSAYPR